jgi:hypothetical protein
MVPFSVLPLQLVPRIVKFAGFLKQMFPAPQTVYGDNRMDNETNIGLNPRI